MSSSEMDQSGIEKMGIVRGQRARGGATQELEQESHTMHITRAITAELSQEKDKQGTVICQRFRIHWNPMTIGLY